MPKTPLSSTYRQGGNRVTSSMLAGVERILATASGESSLAFVTFANQIVGPGAVPDVEISACFHYLVEVKTTHNAVNLKQLNAHLHFFLRRSVPEGAPVRRHTRRGTTCRD